MDDLLFNTGDLDASLRFQLTKMHEAVEAELEDHLHQADADEWAEALAHHFAVDCPTVKASEIWMEPVMEVKVDVSWDRGRYFGDYASEAARNYPGYRIVVHVPFEGDRRRLRALHEPA
ncbi:MAG: hypothetical protein H0W14_11335 [Actinobacteria bacterium]|nr:hypothetical protein [Actinomycetota bacterium]